LIQDSIRNPSLDQIQALRQLEPSTAKRVFQYVPEGFFAKGSVPDGFFASGSGAAASDAPAGVYLVPGPQGAGCPVAMRAEHGGGGALVRTRQSRSNLVPEPAQPTPPYQQIRLILGPSSVQSSAGARVVRARVTVRGTNGQWRSVPTGMGEGSSTIAKTLDLSFSRADVGARGEDGLVATEMTLAGFSSVKSINLDSLTYSDGTIWVPAQGKACRVAPDLLMLVSTR
jgi:hypothetical protein